MGTRRPHEDTEGTNSWARPARASGERAARPPTGPPGTARGRLLKRERPRLAGQVVSARPAPPPVSRTQLYWTCQLGGWALALGAFVVLAALTGGIEGPAAPSAAEVVVSIAVFLAVGVGGTHAVHLVATRRGWLGLSLGALAWRLALAVGAAAAAMQPVSYGLARLTDPIYKPHAVAPLPPPDLPDLVGGTLMLAALYAVWATVYALAATAFRLADAERDRLRLRASLAEARMRALEAQLNPHFLFNALNTVRALVTDEPAEARRAVTLLSAILRRTLAAGREPTHPVAAELDLVRDYLALEGIRFERRLRARVEAEDGALGAEVPALLVQTLVENAVKHGVARRRDGGDVDVRVALDGAGLVVRVESPLADGAADAEGTGVGLANARERLALLYGAAARLSLTLADGRAVAEAHVPATAHA